jgi:hypothetical protein
MMGFRAAVWIVLLAVAALSVWAIQQGVTMGLAALALLGAAIFMFLRPNTGTVLFLALAYTNAPVLLGQRIASPHLLGAAMTVLIMVPIVVHMAKRRGLVVDYSFLLMLLLLGALAVSTMFSVDSGIAMNWVLSYLIEGVLIYVLVLNAIRTIRSLKTAMWTLILVGAILGGMALYQELLGSYRQDFGGLMQRNTERMEDEAEGGLMRERESVKVSNRAGGPTGGPNRFAQILIVILPLAFFRARDEKRKPLRLLAMAAAFLVLCGFFLTYSRGGFLTFAVLCAIMMALRYIRVGHVIAGGLLGALMVTIVAPGFYERIDTMRVIPQLLSNREVVSGHGAIRGRLTETLAAINVFFDHPVLGVGPGQFTPFYSVDYMDDPDVAFRSIAKTRRSHCLYAELAAETGLVGITLFVALVWLILTRLWKLRARLQERRPELAHLALAFWLAVLGYLGTAWFLQLSYQRYMWILFALAGAAVQVLQAEVPEEEEEEIRLLAA